MKSLYDLLKNNTLLFPEKIAIKDATNAISYVNLINEVNDCIHNLKDKLNANSCIILSGQNSISMVVHIIALLELNHSVLLLDTQYLDTELENINNIYNANYLLYFNRELNNVEIKQFSTGTKNNNVNSAIVLTSSGSTGLPKIFSFKQENLLEKLLHLKNVLALKHTDKILIPLSITHSHGFIMTFQLLLVGGAVYYLENNQNLELFFDTINKEAITVLTGVPYTYYKMLNYDFNNSISSLRICFCGSAPMSKYLAESFENKFNIKLQQAYGLSEIGPICVNFHTTDNNNYQTVGKVLPYIQYKIIDEVGNQVNKEVSGELIVKSNYMCTDYVGNVEQSNLTFKNGWLYTNDIVKEDKDGYIYILGRKSTFININGFKVYPNEVEHALLSLEGILEAAVVGAAHEKYIEQIIAFVVLSDTSITKEQIMEHCSRNLSKYKIPHQIYVVDDLPKSSIDKIQYAKLSSITTNS